MVAATGRTDGTPADHEVDRSELRGDGDRAVEAGELVLTHIRIDEVPTRVHTDEREEFRVQLANEIVLTLSQSEKVAVEDLDTGETGLRDRDDRRRRVTRCEVEPTADVGDSSWGPRDSSP
jgi:hypothetical protein